MTTRTGTPTPTRCPWAGSGARPSCWGGVAEIKRKDLSHDRRGNPDEPPRRLRRGPGRGPGPPAVAPGPGPAHGPGSPGRGGGRPARDSGVGRSGPPPPGRQGRGRRVPGHPALGRGRTAGDRPGAAEGTMSRQDFLAAILADPDSGVPRLVLADYLEEQGNPDGPRLRGPGRWVLWTEIPRVTLRDRAFLAWEDFELPAPPDSLVPPVVVGLLESPPACDRPFVPPPLNELSFTASSRGPGGCQAGRASVRYGGHWLCWACAVELSRRRLRLLDRGGQPAAASPLPPAARPVRSVEWRTFNEAQALRGR